MNDAEWHAWRDQGLGASEVPALLGLSSFDSPWSLWAKKVGLLPRTETTERQELGHDLEPIIAKRFKRRTGLYVAGAQTWCTHPQHSWARATVDDFAVESPNSGIDDAVAVAEWKSDGGPISWHKTGIPARVQAQCQWQMFVTGLDEAWLGVFHSGFKFEVYQLHRDERDVAFIFEQAERFWHDHVLAGVPPEVDGSDATHDAISAVWPQHQVGNTVEIDPHLVAWREELKGRIKDRQRDLDEIENAIREQMKDAEVATVGGVPVLTLRSQERTGIDTKALRAAHPDIARQFETTSSYRVLRTASKPKDKAA